MRHQRLQIGAKCVKATRVSREQKTITTIITTYKLLDHDAGGNKGSHIGIP